MFRTVLERLSHKVALRRRLRARVGGQYIYASPDVALMFWKRDLDRTDPVLFDSAIEFIKAGDVVWDVGANVGLSNCAAASVCGPDSQVLEIEADLRLVKCFAGRPAPKIRKPRQSLCFPLQ